MSKREPFTKLQSEANKLSKSTSTIVKPSQMEIKNIGTVIYNPRQKTVRRNQLAVFCDGCEAWYHLKCSGLSKDAFQALGNSVLEWHCLTCSLPCFSDSFFDSSLSSHAGFMTDSKFNSSTGGTTDVLAGLREHANKQCLIGNLNINSLPGKFPEMQEWIETFDILSVQETKIDRTFPISQFAVKGYNTYRRDRKKGGGGLLLFIRSSIPSYQVKIKCKELEAILVDVQLGRHHFSLLSVYKPPSVNNETFTTEMGVILDAAISNRPDVICIGDFNADILNPMENSKQGRTLLDICDIYDLHNLIMEPTRISSTRKSCLDVFLTNAPKFALKSGTYESGLSDHMLIYTVLNTNLMKPKTTLIKGRSFKNFNEDEFNNDLRFVPFNVAHVFDDIDDTCWAWEKLYSNVLDDHAPMKTRKHKTASGQSKFITPVIRKAIRARNALKRKYNKTRTMEDWEAYRSMRNRVVTMRRKSVMRHFEQLCINRSGNPKEFWKAIRPFMHSKNRTPYNQVTLKEGNTVIRDQEQVAETLNDYFINVANDLDTQGHTTISAQSHASYIPVDCVHSFGFRLTNHHEVKAVQQ